MNTCIYILEAPSVYAAVSCLRCHNYFASDADHEVVASSGCSSVSQREIWQKPYKSMARLIFKWPFVSQCMGLPHGGKPGNCCVGFPYTS